MCNKKVIKLNNFENSNFSQKSTLSSVSTLLSHFLDRHCYKKIIIWSSEALILVSHDTKNLYVFRFFREKWSKFDKNDQFLPPHRQFF